MNSNYIQDYELEEMLEKAEEISKKLPLSTEKFNQEVEINRFSRLNDGGFYSSYHFTLNENSLLLLSRRYKETESREVILKLDRNISENLAEDYLDFIASRPELDKFQGHIKRIVSKLA